MSLEVASYSNHAAAGITHRWVDIDVSCTVSLTALHFRLVRSPRVRVKRCTKGGVS